MKKLQISELPLYPIADNKFYGFILTSSPSWPGGASHFFLDEKVTKKSRQKMLPPTGHTPRLAFLSGRRTFVLEIITAFSLIKLFTFVFLPDSHCLAS